MARLLLAMGVLALSGAVFTGCKGDSPDDDGGTSSTGTTGTTYPDDDAGPVYKDPDLADTFGPFTGAFDVNGSGRLLAIQVDGHLAVEMNDAAHVFLGQIDGGAFDAETNLPALETCGDGGVTFAGSYQGDGGGSYQATYAFCVSSAASSGPVSGSRFIFPHVYRQDLGWSGAYDVTQAVVDGGDCLPPPDDGGNTWTFSLGVSRDRDGGAVTAALFDARAPELVFGAVDDSQGVLTAHAQDDQGAPTSTFTLYFIADGGVAGAREVTLPGASGGCTAQLSLFGAKR